MKQIIFIMAAALCLAACNQNTPDDTKKGGDTTSLHQPSDPATWSPAGKIYIRDVSSTNAFGYDYMVEVVAFYTKDSAASYSTTNRDLSPMDLGNRYDPAHYTISYPNLLFDYVYDTNVRRWEFIDTLTLETTNTFKYQQ